MILNLRGILKPSFTRTELIIVGYQDNVPIATLKMGDSEIVRYLATMTVEEKQKTANVSLCDNYLVFPCHKVDLDALLESLPNVEWIDLSGTEIYGEEFGTWLINALKEFPKLKVCLSGASVELEASWYTKLVDKSRIIVE